MPAEFIRHTTPMPNANLSEQGMTLQASTDVEGNCEILQVPAGSYTLVVTYVGFRRSFGGRYEYPPR